jgi:GntR family transcriptional regulator
MPRDKKPLYRLVYDSVKKDINDMHDGERIPSIDELCLKYDVSKTVVREAISALERDGFIIRKQGLGTFVLKNSSFVHTGIEYLRGLPNIIKTSGREPSIKYDELNDVKPPEFLLKKLNLGKDDDLLLVSRTYSADKIPAIFAETYILPPILKSGRKKFEKEYSQIKGKTITIFDILEKKFSDPIKYAVADISSEVSDSFLSNKLKIPKATPLVVLNETHYDIEGNALLYSVDYINTDIFRIHVFRKKI